MSQLGDLIDEKVVTPVILVTVVSGYLISLLTSPMTVYSGSCRIGNCFSSASFQL